MLLEQIDKDLIEALKAKDETKVSTIRMFKSTIHNWQIAKRAKEHAIEKEPQDADILAVIQKEIKSRKDSIEMYEKGGRGELAEKEQKEIVILSKYLPEQASPEEIRAKAKEIIAQTGASSIQDMGKVMGPLIDEFKGKADGATISSIVKEELNK